MSEGLVQAAYILAALLFIMSLADFLNMKLLKQVVGSVLLV